MKKREFVFGAMLLLSSLFLQCTLAQTRIAVLADTHVVGPGLVVSDGAAWQAELAADRKMLDYSRQIFDQLTDKLKADAPEVVLLPGDLTKDGERLSHEYVSSKLGELVAAGIKVYVTPGNHDLGTGRASVFDGDAKSPAETVDASQFATLYASCGYGEGSEIHGLSYAVEPVEGLLLLSIDSHSGSVSADDLDWACGKAEQAAKECKQVLVMMHHPLMPHIYGAEIFVNTSTVGDYETVRNRLADAGVRVVLTGHFHTSDIAKDWNADMTKEIYDINTGSTVSYPCDYRMLTLSANRAQLSVTTGSVTSLEGVDDFGSVAKERLTKSMSAIATNMLQDKLGALAVMAGPLAAQAFVLHAEGDENNSETAQTMLNTLGILAAQQFPDLNSTMQSALSDISNYGTERADQTPDRTLTIDLPVLTSGISSLRQDSSHSDEFYTLQGVRTAKPAKGVNVKDGRLVVF